MVMHFYKTIIISLTMGSLLIFQPTQLLAAGVNSTDSRGVITNTQTHTLKRISDTDMLTSLTMLAGGMVAGRMLASYSPMTTDVMIAGGAGAMFILGEVISNVKFKGTIDKMIVEVEKKSDGTVNEEQIQRLQDLKKSYEEAKSTTQTKKTLQLGAAAGFGAAALTALYLDMAEKRMLANCQSAITTATTLLNTCSPLEKPACSTCQSNLESYRTTLTGYVTERKGKGKSRILDERVLSEEEFLQSPPSYCATNIGLSSQIKMASEGVGASCVPQVKFYVTQEISKRLGVKAGYENFQSREINYFERGINFIFPGVQASVLPLLGLGGGLATSFLLLEESTAKELDLLMFVPQNRAIAFGLFSALSLAAANSSNNVIEKLEKNIAKIDTILEGLNKMALGIKGQNLIKQTIKVPPITISNSTLIPFSENNKLKTECLVSNNTENCKPAADQLKSLPGFANLPESLKNIATQTTSIGDKISGTTGISGSTITSAENLGNKAKAIARVLAERQTILEKASGGKLNFKKEEQNLLNAINDGNKKALEKRGLTASGLLASIGGSPLSSTVEKDSAEKKETVKVVPANAINIAGREKSPVDKEDKLNFDFKEAPIENVALNSFGGSHSKAEYEIDSKEINGEDGPTLFELISGRYIKSGYPKLLEEEATHN